MTNVYLSYNNSVSSLGFSSEDVIDAIVSGKTGVKKVNDSSRFMNSFYGSLIDSADLERAIKNLKVEGNFTTLEKMMIVSLTNVIHSANIPLTEKVGLIISTTKGNIDVLEKGSPFPAERAYLSVLGKTIRDVFGFKNEPIIVSNACVSGLLSISVAKRYLVQGIYDNVFVVSGDLISEFVVSGFNSFQALSNEPCKPYSIKRSGINLGEVAASVLVTSDKEKLTKESVELLGDATRNDANHISGPSRTGEGLYQSVKKAMEEAKVSANELDYISAHGTATPFNDEMEAIAFDRLRLNHIPTNSLKGYFGHTLGASGLLETIVGMHSLHRNTLFASSGFDTLGVSKPINIIDRTRESDLNIFLKTASGFGGCNTAAIFKKVNV
ncbi:beta-ketoacyl synthase [Subsaxibacter sp. CAU 1640]|uniref:beta-ketoacyl-[acyl-carrier-protein] synthase family protein n=1 Tax=Subsaxibacter sp. CAU 1640 TaxID=2933271 RepID=UPI002005CEA7|nr:beta-ketoacyl synthase N-terminal-like domain-containing protein [Subsaxibacter sp. CAU 1640]MCK7589450.1 beta-ketoacyl synthase [Subsaxibacter sp. CAU 1640]